ncbi:MAG: LysR family transcriptional regulator [Propionibacteriaceae bacterium]|nr:LysR family transcriptional regulator [Propionibacteriaceae bacterium]
MALDPRRVLIFHAVVTAGSISAGARALGWTQPAVTQHIAALEKSVGMPLILRRPTGVVPTPAGHALMAHAEAVASHLDAAWQELDELRHCRAGTVRLAAFPSALATIIPHAMKILNDQGGGGLHVRLIEAEPDDALASLRADEVDLAVTFGYSDVEGVDDIDEGFERVPLGVDPVLLVLPPTHPLAHQEDLHLGDLADQEWVAGCPRCREHLVGMARRAGFEPRISHETDDYVVVQSIVSQGLAVSVLPKIALSAYHSRSVVVRDAPELTGRRVEAVYRPGAGRIPSVALVLSALRATHIG